MIFESKRLLELAGLPVEGESNLLKESKEEEGKKDVEEFSSNDGVTEGEAPPEKDECDEGDDAAIREAVRSQLEQMWASGEVFGRKAANRGGVTLGFPGVGFKK
jgi:hypothetical protein